MATEISKFKEWTFYEECEPSAELLEVLLEDEEVHVAYKTIRDIALVTNKRLLIADKQGMRGKKVEIYTIPYKSIVMYSSENAGSFLDFNAELEIWTRIGNFKLNLNKGVDIRKLDKIIGSYIL